MTQEIGSIPRHSKQGYAPLSFAQNRFWITNQLQPDNTNYSDLIAIRLNGLLDVKILERSLNEIIQRHEVLRTTFTIIEGQPVQNIVSMLPLSLSVVDLRGLTRPEQFGQIEQMNVQGIYQPFNLTRGPLIRSTLLQLSVDEFILLLTVPQISFDDWSIKVLFEELAALYGAYALGKLPRLPGLPIQYVDFANWQRWRVQSGLMKDHLAYWKQRLKDSPELLQLPLDHLRPTIRLTRSAQQSTTLPKELTKKLELLSQQEKVKIDQILFAAFQIMLMRYTGQEDLIVGMLISNRDRIELAGLIGPIANWLAVRTNLSDNPTFRQLLGQVRETISEARAHQELPFEKLVEELQLKASLAYHPLFQVVFVFQDEPLLPPMLPDITCSLLEYNRGAGAFDVELVIANTEQGLACSVQYSTELFESTTIKRMLGHFQMLLEGIVDHREGNLLDLPLLKENERHQLLVEWNETRSDYPRDRCIHQLFEERAAYKPETIAVVFEDQRLTYRELNQRANQLAHYLLKLGVGPEVRVGVCVERSLEMIIVLLGILKAGGAYVPLDPTYPRYRLAFLMQDSQVRVLLAPRHLVEQLPQIEALVIYLDNIWATIAQESWANPSTTVAADNLAYVIYTSGSTGIPKGVCCNHYGVINFLVGFEYKKSLSEGAACSLWTNISFDVSVYEIFSALLMGGTLHIVPENVRSNSIAFFEWSMRYEIKSSYIPPFMLTELVTWLTQGTLNPVKFPLHRLLVGVEPIQERLLASLRQFTPGLHIFNGYGATETSGCATFYSVEPELTSNNNTPVGRPAQNIQVYLLDAHLQPVPVGVPGEIYIGGDGLARGYLNRPELTAERFIPNPFSTEPGTRLYKTGDLARYRADGNIEFIGRVDNQVKIRGFRIELGEIEAVLCQHSALSEAVVLAREDAPGEKRLVAYVVPYAGQPEPTTYDLRRFLGNRLPDYMIPSAFMVLDALPLTSNGKVDRQALPLPERSHVDETRAVPRTSTEAVLLNIWKSVLGLEQVGIEDNFFELGGHSLLATQIISRIRDAFQVELPLRCLFETPTIAGLASVVTQYEAEQADREVLSHVLVELEHLSEDEI